jgi:hypothetical protein
MVLQTWAIQYETKHRSLCNYFNVTGPLFRKASEAVRLTIVTGSEDKMAAKH